MSVQLYLGPSGSGKSYQINRRILKESAEHEDTLYLLIVPDQFTMQTQRDIVEQHPRHGIMNIDVLSFGRLSHRIFEELGDHGRTVMDDTGKNLILRKLCYEHEKELKVIGRNIRRPGYIHEIKSAVSEFKQYGISTDDLKQMEIYSEKKALLSGKLQDLRVLYELFDSYKREHYITSEETLELLASEILRSEKMKKSVVVFDGFTGFTPVQYRVIEALMLTAKKLIFSFTTDNADLGITGLAEQDLFYLTGKNIEKLKKIAEELHILEEKPVILSDKPVFRYRENPELDFLEENLFRYSKAVYEKPTSALELFETADMREEIREVAVRIKELTLEEGISYSDIAVVAGNPEEYVPIVRQEFSKYGIPFFSDATKSLVMNPLTEYIKGALAVINTDFSYEAIFHFLRSGLADMKREDTDLLENYVRARGIRGRKEWSKRFVYKTVETGDTEEGLAYINDLREKVVVMLEELAQMKADEKATAARFTEILYRFLVKGNQSEKLAAYADAFREQGDYVREKEFSQVYRLIMDLFHQVAVLLPGEEITLQEYAKILEAGFTEIRVGLLPGRMDYVLVGDIERTRLKEVQVLFFIGVNDGVIPKKGGHGGIFSDIEREFLVQYGVEMAPTPREQMYTQRFYLYMNMTKPKKRLYVSYIRVNEKGDAVRPAYLIEELIRLFPKTLVKHPEYEDWKDKLKGREDSIMKLAQMLNSYAAGRCPEKEEQAVKTLWNLCDTGDGRLQNLENTVFIRYEKSKLPLELAQKLYGTVVKCSVSRLEQFASCAYAHFLKYGLNLKEREEYSFENQDVGSLYHEALMIFGKRLESDGRSWKDFTEDYADLVVEDVVNHIADDYHGAILRRSARNEFQVRRMKDILKRSIMTVSWQLAKGEFRPTDYEAKFDITMPIDGKIESKDISPDVKKLRLQGSIDRIDVCEKADYCLVKVQDYKSGKKEFDLKDFLYGIQLQLPLYMNCALEMKKTSYPGKDVKPSAMLYYHISDPVSEVTGENESEEEIKQSGFQALRQTGVCVAHYENLISLDRDLEGTSDVIPVTVSDCKIKEDDSVLTEVEQQIVAEYTEFKVKELAGQIISGESAAYPYSDGDTSACTYCDYHEICGFDQKIPGYERNVSFEKTDKKSLFARMKQKMAEEE